MNQHRYTMIGVLCLCIAFTAHAQENNEPTELVTIDAAMSYDLGDSHFLLLFSGSKVQSIENYKNDGRIEGRDLYMLPEDMKLQAAYARRGNPFYRRYFGDEYGYNVDPNYQSKRFKYGPNRAFLRNGGPDAAARRKGVVYFFKGCKMAARRKLGQWGKIKETSSVGLPCDIDAAWAEQGDKLTVLLKGDQFWAWKEDNSVTGPQAFHNNYPLKGWTLAPVT